MRKILFYVSSGLLFLLFWLLPLVLFAQSVPRINAAELINSINSGKGQAVLVVFWATWCQPCKKELPEIESLSTKFPEEKIKILGVSLDNNPRVLAQYLQRNSLDFKTYLAGSDISNIFRVQGVPKLMLYDQDGQCVFKHTGLYPIDKLELKISKYLKR